MGRAEACFEVVNERGLHTRAASSLVQVASRFECEIVVATERHSANAKSVMGVLLLCGARGTRVRVVAEGEGAEEALEAIGRLFAERFGEEH